MMKKTLVALAATAVTGAFAQVAITGNIDLGIQNVDAQATTSKSVGLTKNNVSTSSMGFSGSEDLGGGLKASFKLEWAITPEASSTLNSAAQTAPYADGQFFSGGPFNSEQFLALSGDWGTVRAGEPNAAVYRAQFTSQPFGTALGSGYSGTYSRMGYTGGYGVSSFMGLANGGGNTLRVIRNQKTIQYETPVMSGFSAMAEYQFGNDNATSSPSASNTPTWLGLLVNYSAGALNVSAAYNKYSHGTNDVAGNVASTNLALTTISLANNADVTYQFVGANYTLGANTFYAGLSNVRASDATEDSQSWNVAYKFALNANTDILANVVSTTNSLVSTTSLSKKLIGLGADYRLSKRTSLYARYENTDTNTDNTASGEVIRTAFGVRHQF